MTKFITNIAELISRKGTAKASFSTLGYYTAYDGGHNTYVWDSTSTATPDNGSIFQVTGQTTGRWFAIYNSTIRAKAWGVKADAVTDDLPRLQPAINYTLNYGLTLEMPGGIINVTNPVVMSLSSPAFLPFSDTGNIKGAGPATNWLASNSSETNGTVIRLIGTGKTAIVDVKVGASRYLKMSDFTVSCNTVGGATYGLLWSESGHSEHVCDRVHSYRANIGIGILKGAYANGEFITFNKCKWTGETIGYFMDTDTGQSFNHYLNHCHGSVTDGGTIFEVGGGDLGFGLTAIEFESSNTIDFSTSTGVTFIKNKGASGNFNFIGGRIEGVSTVLWNVQATNNIINKWNFSGMHFDGLGSSASRIFLKSTGSNSRGSYTFDNCLFTPLTGSAYNTEININLGSIDASLYKFRQCEFADIPTYKTILSESITGQVIFEECTRKNLSTTGIVRFNKSFAYNTSPRKLSISKPQNILLQSGFKASFGGSPVTPTSPWVGNLYTLQNDSGHSGAYVGTDANFRQVVFAVGTPVYQDVTGFTFGTGVNVAYYRALVSYHASNGMSLRITLLNATTGKIYDQLTVKGSATDGNILPIELTANDSNVGGNLRLRFENLDLGNPFYLNIYNHHVCTNNIGSYSATTTTAVDLPFAVN